VSGGFGASVFGVVFMYGAFDLCSVVVLLSIQLRNVDDFPLLPAHFESTFMGFAISHSRNYRF
jgi:hypothetical protein